LDLFREFETKKRSIRPKQTNKVVITLPVALTDLVKKQHKQFENAVEASRHKMSVNYVRQKLHISPEAFRDLFKPTIDSFLHRFWPFRTTFLVTGCKSASHSGQF
jgi:hypothetical protein